MRKIITLGIMLLFLGMTISSSGYNLENQSIKPMSSDNTLYVGGNGPNNYTKIQDAIDNASDGDTVFVYDDSSPYLEKIQIDKSIRLIGEHRDNTVIDGGENNFRTISISVDSVDVQGFTIFGEIKIVASYTIIFNNNIICLPKHNCIVIQPTMNENTFLSNNTIIGNTLISNSSCIVVWFSHYSLIADNVIYSRGGKGYVGILLAGNHSIIYGNNVKESDTGIFLGSSNSSVYGNTVSNSSFGLFLCGTYDYELGYNKIYLNTIKSCKQGIHLEMTNKNEIFENNFLDNSLSAFFIISSNQWQGNYWNRPRIFPKLIFGRIGRNFLIPWLNIDWHPAREPYDIEV